jgi:hypothetical protein
MGEVSCQIPAALPPPILNTKFYALTSNSRLAHWLVNRIHPRTER